MMEIICNVPAIPKIEWNYEELKKELQEYLSKYKNVAYSEENIKEAKEDQALLNKVYKAIYDRKVAVKKEYSKELVAFENDVKSLLAMIDDAKSDCSKALNDMENRRIEERKSQIEAIYENAIGKYKDNLPLSKIFNQKWLNASVSLKQVSNDINTIVINADESLKAIKGLNSVYEEYLTNEYFKTLSLPLTLEKYQELTLYIQSHDEVIKPKEETFDCEMSEMFLKITLPANMIDKFYGWCEANNIKVSELF